MRAITMVAWSDLRRRWVGTLAVAVIVGIVGALVLSTVAGARRTSTALRRFNEYSRSADLEVTPGRATAEQLAAFRTTPGIAALGLLRIYALQPTNATPYLSIGAPVDGEMNNAVDRPRLISGRLADPNDADELDIGESIANLAHLKIGDTLNLKSWSQAQVDRVFTTGKFEPPSGPAPQLHIVGIVRRPLDLGARSAAGGVVVLTPGFNRKYGNQIGTFNGYAMRIRTVSAADVPRVSAQAQAIFGRDPNFEFQSLSVDNSGANGAIRVLTAVLLIFAAVAAVAGLSAIAIVLHRDLTSTRALQPTLVALGLTRRDRFAASIARVAPVAVIGAAVAVVGAVAASPFFPFGIARRADPDTGIHADWLVLAIGGAVVFGAVALFGAFAAWRATAKPRATRGARRPGVAAKFAGIGTGPGLPVAVGLNMATDPGRGQRAVPLRSAFVAAAFAVAGLTAVTVFASSLNRLASNPRRYGAPFGFGVETTNDAFCGKQDHGLAHAPGIASLAAICTESIQVGGHATTGWGALPLRSDFGPVVVAGHVPATSTEVALGASTLSALHKTIGDTVVASVPSGHSEYRIVGQVVFPQLTDAQALADGAWFTQPGFDAILGKPTSASDSNTSRYLVGTFAPHADHAAVVAAVTRATFDPSSGNPSIVLTPRLPVEVSRLRQTNWFPGAIALLLVFLALVTVGHALVTSTRRRRGEFALLKTLGFARGQVRWSVACEATAVALVSLGVGIPLGLLAGVVIWRTVAHGLGVAPDALIPVLVVALVPFMVVAVNVVAYWPARAAARMRAAVALRTE